MPGPSFPEARPSRLHMPADVRGRVWTGAALTDVFMSLTFVWAFTQLPTDGDGWSDLAGAVSLMLIYVVAIVVIIPLGALTIGRWLDGRTRRWPTALAALAFAAVAAAITYALLWIADPHRNNAWLVPALLPPVAFGALAARLSLNYVLTHRWAQITATILSIAPVALLIGLLIHARNGG